MAAENRLTAEQLAGLAPGVPVTIESGQNLGRRRYTSGTVVRVSGGCIVVRCGAYLERYRLRDGTREGGVGHAELVSVDSQGPRADTYRRTAQIDLLYRDWTRDRTDVERLRRLQHAIEECLRESTLRS